MAKVKINPGVCGMDCTVEVTKADRMNYNVKVDCPCKMINEMAGALETVNLRDALKPQTQSKIYEAAADSKTHPVCPVPMAILKAIEVESGMALPRPVNMEFQQD